MKHQADLDIITYDADRKLSKIDLGLSKKPMMTNRAIKYIVGLLEPSDTVLEYGAGGSTTVFSQMVKKYISIEHDRSWLEDIRAHMAPIEALEMHYVEPNYKKAEPDMKDPGAAYDKRFSKATHGSAVISSQEYDELLSKHPYAHEGSYYSSIVRYWQYRDYVDKIYDLGVKKFDKIIVDGRSRTFCSYLARHFMHEDSILLIDDILREHPKYTRVDDSDNKIPTTRGFIEFGDSLNEFYRPMVGIDGLLSLKLK